MTGLAYAINRAYHAWVRTQPQLIIDLWDEAGLDETQIPSAGLRLVEPALSPISPDGGGLTGGADPCCATPTGRRHAVPRVAPPARTGGSAPFQYDGPGRMSSTDTRGQGHWR